MIPQELLQHEQVHLQHNKRPLSPLDRRLVGGRGEDVRRKLVHEGTKTPANGSRQGIGDTEQGVGNRGGAR